MQFHTVDVLAYSIEGSEEAASEDSNSDPKDIETKAEELFSYSSRHLGDSDSSVVEVSDFGRTPDLINLADEDGGQGTAWDPFA